MYCFRDLTKWPKLHKIRPMSRTEGAGNGIGDLLAICGIEVPQATLRILNEKSFFSQAQFDFFERIIHEYKLDSAVVSEAAYQLGVIHARYAEYGLKPHFLDLWRQHLEKEPVMASVTYLPFVELKFRKPHYVFSMKENLFFSQAQFDFFERIIHEYKLDSAVVSEAAYQLGVIHARYAEYGLKPHFLDLWRQHLEKLMDKLNFEKPEEKTEFCDSFRDLTLYVTETLNLAYSRCQQQAALLKSKEKLAVPP
ncbi:hypothetical protein OSTOST_01308 [Ostertagia ostertagi]